MSLSPSKFRLLVISLLTVSFIGALDHTIVATSLATVAGSLGALEQMGWIVVSYTLASTVLLPVLGKLADLFNPRTVFLWSLGVFIVASLACGFAPDMSVLIVARVVQGMSSAGIQLISQTIIAQVTTPRQRPKWMSIMGASFPVAILIGPVLGGLITDSWGWPWVFWINLPIGIVAFALAAIAIPQGQKTESTRFDYGGTWSLTIALVALVLGVSWVGDTETMIAAMVAFGVTMIAFAAFFWIELRVAEPLVPLHQFRNRTVAAGVALSAIIGVAIFSVTAYLPTYIQMAYQTSATVSGLIPIATVMGMLVSNLVTGFLASRTGRYRRFHIAGTVLGTVGMSVMAMLPSGGPLWVPMAVMFVVGLGTGSFMTLVVTVVQSAVPKGEIGSATATVNLVRQIASTVSTAAIGVVIAVGVTAGLPSGLNSSTLTPQLVHELSPELQADVAALYGSVFVPVFAALAITFAVGIVVALVLPAGELSDDPVAIPSTSETTTTRR